MEIFVGKVSDFFAKPSVIAIKLEEKVAVNDTIHIKGHSTDFIQKITSMQIEHKNIEVAEKGATVGIKVEQKARKGDKVYKIVDSV